ncbi:UxaA family hydrolase [Pelagibius sp.]|uniref:UxaA family hydrolase n=1 Tax=Pelagibius sp. TaxID=1931238 RepID=UPI003BB130F9
MSAPDFIVHDAADTVGVIVKEGISANSTLTGWVLEDDSRFEMACIDDIPLGHKIALGEIAEGDTILKYGHDIGKAVAGIAKGGHVHTQNVKTKRW